MKMQRHRLTDLSVVYFVRETLHNSECNTIQEGEQANLYRSEVPYVVRVMDSFPDATKEDVTLPTISITHDTTGEDPFQLGGGWRNEGVYLIDIFGRSNSERDDLAEIIYEGLDRTTTLKDYNDGFPTYVYSSGEAKLVETYVNVPTPLSDIEFRPRTLRTLPRLRTVGEVDTHRALITTTAITLR